MGLSIWHLVIILIIVVFIFGPSRLEGLGSSLGKAIRGFKEGMEGDGDKKDKSNVTQSSATENTPKSDDKPKT